MARVEGSEKGEREGGGDGGERKVIDFPSIFIEIKITSL